MIMPNYPLSEEQKRCPFYGFLFDMHKRVFLQQEGNCGLSTPSVVPCKMESEGECVNWNNCGFNNPENQWLLENLVDSTGFIPKNREELPFRQWYYEVMGESFPSK